jgi:hypothetical protein
VVDDDANAQLMYTMKNVDTYGVAGELMDTKIGWLSIEPTTGVVRLAHALTNTTVLALHAMIDVANTNALNVESLTGITHS